MKALHPPITPTEEFLIKMFYLEGWSMKKEAKELDITLKAVLEKRNRALSKLRRMDRSDLEAYFLRNTNGQYEFLYKGPNQFEEVITKLAQDIEDQNV